MITASHKTLKDLIDSKNGVHLSIYVQYFGGILQFKKRLNSLIKNAEDHLMEVMNPEEITEFLKPLREFASNAENYRHYRGSIGIFMKNDFFKTIQISSDVEELSVTADSFHIKPLINWAQQDHEFILVGLNKEGAHFYKGTPNTLEKIDQIQHSVEDKAEYEFMLKWLGNWIDYLSRKSNTLVFVVADKRHSKILKKSLRTHSPSPTFMETTFEEKHLQSKIRKIRSLVRLNAQTRVNQMLNEFDLYLKLNSAKTNLFQIAKAAVKGKVQKLLVAEDFNIFGRIDKKSGGLSLHPLEMNHEDDCLLDDIAQTVLLTGGEVGVVKKSEMPDGRPILAVLHENPAYSFAEAHSNLDFDLRNTNHPIKHTSPAK